MREEKERAKARFVLEDIIRLNVGGQRFDTQLSTLLADRQNELFIHFSVLLEPDLTVDRLPLRDNEGAFFLDCDPQHFQALLNNLRFLINIQTRNNAVDRPIGFSKSRESLTEDEIRSTKTVGIWSRLKGKWPRE
uniref:BTB_2 domain-containing protein n=1 Tax=Heterorhabditis bacteriophora TaxID=37862 RepID=A0A1I7X6P7_HETBA